MGKINIISFWSDEQKEELGNIYEILKQAAST